MRCSLLKGTSCSLEMVPGIALALVVVVENLLYDNIGSLLLTF